MKSSIEIDLCIDIRETSVADLWSRGVPRWFRWAYLLPALSSAGASLAPPMLRLHTPLIEPDVRNDRIPLSEKGSRGRPRETTRPLWKAEEAQHLIEETLRKPSRRSSSHLVFST